MTNWHDSSLMIVKSADPTTLEGASINLCLMRQKFVFFVCFVVYLFNEIEALLVNGYTLKSITECNGEMFVFLLNKSEIKRQQK